MKICKKKRRFARGFVCRTVIAISEVVIPEGEGIDVPLDKEELIEEVDTFLLLVGPLKRFFIKLLLWFINYLLPILFLRFKPFSRLSFETRYRIMKRIHDSKIFSIRGIYILTSMLILPYYYSRNNVLNAIGYPVNRFKSKSEAA